MMNSRISQLQFALRQQKLDGLVLNPGPSLIHLSGLSFHLMERPVVMIITPDKEPVLILPELEIQKSKESNIPLKLFPYNDTPSSWQHVFSQAMSELFHSSATIGVEPTRIRFLELDFLTIASPGFKYVSAESLLTDFRICKDASEIESIRKAVTIAENALAATLPKVQPGKTEREIAAELTIELLRSGSDSELPFKPIVSGGPHSADPHAEPSDRALQLGDMLVIDWGAAYKGYISDLTRTFAIGKITPEFEKISSIVREANQSACRFIKPGVNAGSVDFLARDIIAKAGFGQYFTHRLGHGIGREPHESPYINSENTMLLKPGMTFTIEPGAYIPNVGGVRIEDNVCVTENGVEILSSFPREVKVI